MWMVGIDVIVTVKTSILSASAPTTSFSGAVSSSNASQAFESVLVPVVTQPRALLAPVTSKQCRSSSSRPDTLYSRIANPSCFRTGFQNQYIKQYKQYKQYLLSDEIYNNCNG